MKSPTLRGQLSGFTCFVVMALLAVLTAPAAAAPLVSDAVGAGVPPDFEDTAVLTGLSQPISIAFLPDGRALILDKGGEILIADVDASPASSATYMTISNIQTSGERGLIDISLDPDFNVNGYFYLYYSTNTPDRFRIARFVHQENSGGLSSRGDLGSEFLVWEDNGDSHSCCHFGAGLDFGPDGKLYLTPGDEFDGAQAQDPKQSGGSIIRVNKDGTIPGDNPFHDGAGLNDDSIWAIGLRNPFRARWDLPTGRFFIGEVGGNDNSKSFEDLHLGRAGANYGWPHCEGYHNNSDFPDCDPNLHDEPIFAYPHSGSGASLTGGIVYRGSQFPSAYFGAYFYGDYSRKWIRYLTFDPNDDTVVTSDNAFQSSAGQVVAIEEGPDGAIYYVQVSGAVRRISYEGDSPPIITQASATPTSGEAPLEVDFQSSATTDGGGALTYTWHFGDGNTSTGANATHTYTSAGAFAAHLEVSDGELTATSDPITIQVGSPPVANIDAPIDGSFFRAGDVISYSGTATGSGSASMLPVTSGLVLHLESDQGIAESGGSVASWADQSGSGNDLSASGAPNLTVAGTPAGLDAITLDGSGDKLERLAAETIGGLPAGSADRTMFTVVRYNSASAWGGVAYGKGAVNATFGLAVNGSNGFMTIQGWGGGNDLVSSTPGIGAGWMIQSTVLASDVVNHFKNGTLIDGPWSHTFNTVVDKIVLGQETAESGYIGMDVAAVLVYDHALSDTERQLVESYLNAKYFGGGSGDLSGDDFSWMIDLVHDQHTHPAEGPVSGASGTFEIPIDGVSYRGDTGYRFSLTVTDGNGLSGSDEVTIYPDKVDLTFDTSPTGIPITIDGTPEASPLVLDALIGFEHTVSVPATRCVNGTEYVFDNWSNNKGREHTLTVPTLDASYTATYIAGDDCSGLAITDGLVLRLESDQGVSNSSNIVGAWADLSGQGNDLTGAGDPQLVAGATPSGLDGIALDGVGDKLERLAAQTITGLPSGAADRTVFTVVRYNSSSAWGGVAYGKGAANATFGVGVNGSAGFLTVQGWGSGNDKVSSTPGIGAGWLIQSAVLASNSVNHFMDGSLIDGPWSHTFDTVVDKIVLGEETKNLGFIEMDVAAVLIYDHALSETARQEVEAYLHDKYMAATTPGNAPPIANNDAASVENGQSLAIDVLVNDTDSDGVLNPATVTIVTAPQNGSIAEIDSETGFVTYTHDGSATLSDSFTYTVEDEVGTASNAATVTISISSPGGEENLPVTSGIVLHLESDLGIATSEGNVAGWLDQSGYGNDLEGAGDPQILAAATPSGQAAIGFDGADDKLGRTSTLNSFPDGSSDRTLFIVANYRSNGYGGFAFGTPSCNQVFGLIVGPSPGNLAVQGWCGPPQGGDFLTDVPGNGAGWLVQSAVLASNDLSHYKDGTLIDQQTHEYNTVLSHLVLGAEIDSNPYLDMDAAAVLVYNRALTESERQQVEAYLQGKYLDTDPQMNTPPLANDDDATVDNGQSLAINVLANDTDDDGSLEPSAVTVLDLPQHGSISGVNTSTGAITYSHDGTETLSDSFTYTVEDDEGDVSNVATVNITVNPPDAGGGETFAIGGTVTHRDPGSTPLETVALSLTGDAVSTTTSAADGSFSFDVDVGGSYSVAAEYAETSAIDAISTLDLALMQQHVLSTDLIADPLAIIAADVNRSGGTSEPITTLDIALTQQIILRTSTSFANGFWTCVVAGQTFSDPADPFPYAITHTFASVSSDVTADFTCFVQGDVNASWQPTLAAKSENGVYHAQMDDGPAVHFEVATVKGSSSQEIVVPIHAGGFEDIGGFQFTLEWDEEMLTYVGIERTTLSGLTPRSFGTHAAGSGVLTTAWIDPNGLSQSVEDGAEIFAVRFALARADGLSSEIAITSSVTPQSAHRGATMLPVQMSSVNGRVNSERLPTEYSLQPAYPNPFNPQATIPYAIPEAGHVRIDVFDAVGRLVNRLVDESKAAGRHEAVFDASGLPSGVYFYRIDAGSFRALQRVTLIK